MGETDGAELSVRRLAALFERREEAQRALEDLRGAGIDPGRVSVISKDAVSYTHLTLPTICSV